MKKRKTKSPIIFLLFIFLANGSLYAQPAQQEMSAEQFYLNQAVAEKFSTMRKAAKSSFNGVLLYPDDIRNAVLELSQYPDLIALLANKKYLSQEELDKFVKEQPQEAKDAVEKLKEYPEVVDILSDHIAVSTILGEVYKDKKETTAQVINRLSDSVQKEEKQSVDTWAQQLQQDPERVKQLQAASEAYAKANNLPSPNQPVSAAQAGKTDNPYGYYVNEKKVVVIYNMPSPQMMQYLLLNQTLYMMLFAAAVSHHHYYPHGYYWNYYDDHWHDEWNQYEDAVNRVGSGLDDLNQNIDEIQNKREEQRNKWEDRKENRPENLPEGAKDKWQDRTGARAETLPAKVQDRKDSPSFADMKKTLNEDGKLRGQQPSTMDQRPLQNNPNFGSRPSQQPMPNIQPGAGFPAKGSNVISQLPSRGQQIGRAEQFHSGSWADRSGGRNFGGGGSKNFGGGSPSGGSRSSGGGSRSAGGSSGGSRSAPSGAGGGRRR